MTWTRAHPVVVDAVLAVLLAALLAPWSVAALFDASSEPAVAGAPSTRPPWPPVVAAAILLGHGALVFRRARPLASFLLVAAAVGVQVATSWWWVLPSVFVFLPALYSCCAHGRRSAPVVALVVGTVGTAAVTALGAAVAPHVTGFAGLAFHVVVRDLPFVLAAWSLGMYRRVRRDHLAALEERALRAEADREERARRAVVEERTRIAREMHDVVAHAWSVVISQAQGGRYAGRDDPDQAIEALTTIAETGRRALSDMRGLLTVLRDDSAEQDGSERPQPGLRDLPELFGRVRESGLTVTVTEHGDPDRSRRNQLGEVAELAVYRLVQEALTNSLKYAGPAATVDVGLTWSAAGLDLRVRDDGPGTDGGDGGQGLVGMRERVTVVGGSVRAGPGPGGGFLVEAHVPATSHAAKETT